MQYREKYISPYRTIQLIERQAGSPENVAFAKANFSNIKNGAQMWHAVKPLVTFKKDPPTVETIQGITSFFNPKANIHSLSGYGDCDCFTSVCASIAKANNLPYNYIMQGNGKPSHIAIEVKNYVVDLTNDQPNYLRPYQTTQIIKPMYVQLSDENEEVYELNDFGRPSINTRRVFNTVNKYRKMYQPTFTPNKLKRIINRASQYQHVYNPLSYIPMPGVFQDESFGRNGRGKEKLKKFSKTYGKYVIGGAAIGASLLIPGSGKVIRTAYKNVPKLLQKGAKLLNNNAGLINSAKGLINKRPQSISPMDMPEGGSVDNTDLMPMPTYQTEAVTVTAQKPINPLFIVGGLALAYFLFTKKK